MDITTKLAIATTPKSSGVSALARTKVVKKLIILEKKEVMPTQKTDSIAFDFSFSMCLKEMR